MGGKWLGVLKEIAPNVKRVGALFATDAAPHGPFFRAAEKIAPSLGGLSLIFRKGLKAPSLRLPISRKAA
jgi:hypothetical protein